MRARAIIPVVAVLLLPSAARAQRFPMRGPRGVSRPQPAPLPPQPGPIARELAYKRVRLSFETYPMVSHFQAPGLTGSRIPDWTSVGFGARADYRLTPFSSLTFDVTSSDFGGPSNVHTAELGTRIHRQRAAGRFYPFADLRVGYTAAFDNLVASGYDVDGNPILLGGGGSRFSSGYGVVAGVGTEVGLTRRFSLTTGASVMRARMGVHSYDAGQFDNGTFGMTMYRLTIGLRYNPVRIIHAAATSVQ